VPSKRKGSTLARWEWSASETSRSKGERIELKMGEAQAEVVEVKKMIA
jgi:hypothetical protein